MKDIKRIKIKIVKQIKDPNIPKTANTTLLSFF